ncbi:MAG: hypothetical protein V4683_08105 [Bacteroidota bacterium]
MLSKYSVVIIFSFLLITCKKETPTEPTILKMDSQFRPFFNSFLKEAKERNVSIDTTNLILTVAKSSNNLSEPCGTCTQKLDNQNAQKIIEINSSNSACWQIATDNAKEALIFHELGHCLLGRIEHKTEKFSDGSPKSLMHPDNFDLYSPCTYAIDGSNDCNKTSRRKYYMDELFNPNTPSPDWAK